MENQNRTIAETRGRRRTDQPTNAIPKNTNKTMEEARVWLRVSQPTLYKLINENKLKTFKIGLRRFTTIQDLENFVTTMRVEATL